MENEFDFPHTGYYQSARENDCQFKTSFSSRMHVERLINGQPAFIHHDAESGLVPKTLVINDWRYYFCFGDRHKKQMMHDALQDLINRENNPFTIYFPYQESFCEVTSNTTLTDMLEMAEMELESNPNFLLSNEEMTYHFIKFFQKDQGNVEFSQDNVFIIDQFEMDALLRKSKSVEYSSCIQELDNIEHLVKKFKYTDLTTEQIFEKICDNTLFYTSNLYICFDDGSDDAYFLHEHIDDKARWDNQLFANLAASHLILNKLIYSVKLTEYLIKQLKNNLKDKIKPSHQLNCDYILNNETSIKDIQIKETPHATHKSTILKKTTTIDLSHPLDSYSYLSNFLTLSNNITKLILPPKDDTPISSTDINIKKILYKFTHVEMSVYDENNFFVYQSFCESMDNLQSLSISFMDSDVTTKEDLFSDARTSIKHLVIRGVKGKSKHLHNLLTYVPNIESLTIDCELIDECTESLIELPYLKKIQLDNLDEIDDDNEDTRKLPLFLTQHLSKSATNLTYLGIESAEDRAISLNLCSANEHSFYEMLCKKKLKKIMIRDFCLSRDDIKKILIANQESLSFLDLTYTRSAEQEDPHKQLLRSDISTNLKYFNYGNSYSFDVLYEVISSSPHLRKVDLGECMSQDLYFNLQRRALLNDAFNHCIWLTCIVSETIALLSSPEEIQQAREDNSLLSLIFPPFSAKSNKDSQHISNEKVYNEVTMGASFNKTEDDTFYCQQIFQHKSGSHPPVSQYRLGVYDKLVSNPEKCFQHEAFTITHYENDLDLIDIELLEDCFTEVKELPDDTTDKKHYIGNQLFEANTNWQPIASLSGNEKLLSYTTSNDIPITVKYSNRDNLYYLKTDATIKHGTLFKICFMLQVPIIKPSDAYKNFIEETKTSFENYKNEPLALQKERYTGHDFYRMMIKQKKGCCRHRAIITKIEMDISNPGKERKNRIITNSCHAYIELVTENSRCHKIELGGAPGRIVHTTPLLPSIKTPPSVEPSELGKTTENSALIQYQSSKVMKKLGHRLEDIEILADKKTYIQNEFHRIQASAQYSMEEVTKAVLSPNTTKNILIKSQSMLESFDTLLKCIYPLDKSSQPYHIIYHPDELLTQEKYIASLPGTNEGEIINERGGKLFDFLQFAKQTSAPFYLFVMYDAFSKKEIIKFNRLIDEELRFADCVELSNNIKVIGIYNTQCPKAYKGSDFSSRFKDKFSLKPKMQQQEENMDENVGEPQHHVIELFNDPFWQERLLGHWQMQGDKLYFVKSEFIEKLENGDKAAFTFNNPPDNLAFYHCLKKATQQGYFTVNGAKVPIPANFGYTISEGYDYSPFLSHITVSLDEHLDPTSMLILNESVIEDFIGGYAIESKTGLIKISQGLLASGGTKSHLHLFIHNTLSGSSWAKLLHKIEQYQTKVTFHTSSSELLPKTLMSVITMDEANETNDARPDKRQRQDEDTNNSVVVIKDDEGDIDFAQQYYIEQSNIDPNTCLIIDISEVNVEQLIFKAEAMFVQQTSSFLFKRHPGVLLNSDYQDQTVIVKGVFSSTLVNALAKLICQRLNILQNTINQRLILIPQNSDCFDFLPNNAQYTVELPPTKRVQHKQLYLSTSLGLPLGCIKETIDREEVCNTPLVQLQSMYFDANNRAPWQGAHEVTHNDYSEYDIDFSNASSITTKFYQERMIQLEKRLQVDEEKPLAQSCFVNLTGLTGVGKTHFIQHAWSKKYPNCHYGMSNLVNFCNDKRNGIKTLFIDEANLENTDFSVFEGLFNDTPHVLIEQEVHTLTKHHKVIFAGNPASYSNDRNLFSLATKHGNCCLFSEIPPEVLYQAVLNPLFAIYQVDNVITADISKLFLKRQFNVNHLANRIIISPRELTAMVLMTMQHIHENTTHDELLDMADRISHQVIISALPIDLRAQFSKSCPKPTTPKEEAAIEMVDGFLVTPSRVICQESLETLLSIRKQRQNSMMHIDNDTFKYDGLNAALVEGEPGIGKSALVKKVLTKNNITYIQIAASQSIEDKEAALINAFNDGEVVLMDEYNTAHLNEKFMNAILSGIHPETHQRPNRPGFLLIATQNPPSMSGRKVLGDAIKRRFLHCPLPAYTHDEMVSIVENLGIDNSTAEFLVLYYQQQKLKMSLDEASLCFRDLLNIAKQTGAQKFAFSRDYDHLLFWNFDSNSTSHSFDGASVRDKSTSLSISFSSDHG